MLMPYATEQPMPSLPEPLDVSTTTPSQEKPTPSSTQTPNNMVGSPAWLIGALNIKSRLRRAVLFHPYWNNHFIRSALPFPPHTLERKRSATFGRLTTAGAGTQTTPVYAVIPPFSSYQPLLLKHLPCFARDSIGLPTRSSSLHSIPGNQHDHLHAIFLYLRP